MGGSTSKSSSKPKDMTPQPFKDLQQPLADQIGNLISQFGANNSAQDIIKGYQGNPQSAPITGNEQSILDQLSAFGKSSTSMTPTSSTKYLQGVQQVGAAPGMTNAFVNGLNLTNGAPKSTVPTGSLASYQNTVAGASKTNAFGGAPQASLADYQKGLAGASQTGAYGGTQNPFLQSYIQAAQRETQQALEETLGRTLPGRFTAAGQTIQPRSSSAFDRAAAIATRGTADALGDISTNISYNAYSDAANREAESLQNEVNRRFTGDQNAANREAESLMSELTRRYEGGQNDANRSATQALQNQQLTATAKQNQLDRGLAATDKLQAGKTADSAIKAQEVDTMVKNLQAQALPRLIQDLGIERGTEIFNQKVNSILATIGLASGVTRPVIGNQSSSSSSSMQLK